MSNDIELDYDYLMQRAFRYLMRDVLTLVAELGDAPGEHHFYIEFMTGADGVSVPDRLKEQYPERMTIVLQHQFDGLTVTEDMFEVTLWFNSIESHLVIPFDAVTSFADPSTEFGLRFEPPENGDAVTYEQQGESEGEVTELPTANEDGDAPKTSSDKKDGDSADVVSLDAFRKK